MPAEAGIRLFRTHRVAGRALLAGNRPPKLSRERDGIANAIGVTVVGHRQMSDAISADRIRGWIDEDLVESVEPVPDEAAEFNLAVEMSNIVIHVIRRRPDGPLLVGQQIEYGEEIRSRIRDLSAADRSALVTRIRETLAAVPVVYGFQDRSGTNVRFEEMSRIFLEHRLYPGAISQDALMNGLVEVWKAMRYLDDIVSLLDSVERRG